MLATLRYVVGRRRPASEVVQLRLAGEWCEFWASSLSSRCPQCCDVDRVPGWLADGQAHHPEGVFLSPMFAHLTPRAM